MRYAIPKTAAEAASLLMEEAARVLAGGTDLLVQMKSGVRSPEVIVDIKHLPGLRDISREGGGFRIGAAVSGAEMQEDAELVAAWPGVVEGVNLIGSTQIQGRATMAGNLCNGSPAADGVPAQIAAQAVARIAGPEGERDCPVAEIPTGPGKTSLGRGEFIASILLPARPDRSGDAYLRFIPRTEMDIAVAGAAVNLVLAEDGTVKEARVALGAVAPTAILVEEAGAALVGSKLEEPALAALVRACEAACKPIDDKRGTAEFRTHVAGVLAKRAARIAYDRAGGRA
ncbi:oxidoreductase [Defluviimonas sp. 20V17]|uniref:Carbon-monoxide dehydrogenase medium subunit n=1 Tax=Allgaiera indica TaxID=765699 RepID=A0AAN4UPY6_9RHOB|nr:xanthine dehydrogenase family protein subunit M [Allgaiera indica]KDB03852.1 oxidoreductase [Defluviimonas sp. 20V17]GHE00144.1 oxidoreductase [Allgaiera indica]SDW36354.1 carbon-monoxide dehydrogenase medium subunit [Allgaiera indica]